MMSAFVESLWRLYRDGMVSIRKIEELYNDKKITEAEKLYILSTN